jgi:hypothetical protein
VVVAGSDQCVCDGRLVDPDVLLAVQGLAAQTVAAWVRQAAA